MMRIGTRWPFTINELHRCFGRTAPQIGQKPARCARVRIGLVAGRRRTRLRDCGCAMSLAQRRRGCAKRIVTARNVRDHVTRQTPSKEPHQ